MSTGEIGSLEGKLDWEKRRDTHGTEFPESLRNWVSLDPVWRAKSEAVESAFIAVAEGRPPAAEAFAEVRSLEREMVDPDWTVDEPVVREELPEHLDWMLFYRDLDQMTAMTLSLDGYFERIFWEAAFAGEVLAFAVACERPKTQSKKIPPAGSNSTS